MTDSVRILLSKLRGALSQQVYLPRVIALAWRAAPRWTLAWLVLVAVQALLPVAVVWLVRLLVDGLVAAFADGGGLPSIRPVLVPVALLAGVMLLTEILRSSSAWVRSVQAEFLKDHISALIQRKSAAVDLAFYEMPEFYDHLHRAREEAGYRPGALLVSVGGLLRDSLTLAAMGAMLIPFGLWLPAVLLVSAFPALLVVVRGAVHQHRWRLRATADERRTWYYDWLLTTGETATELRLFGLAGHFQSLYVNLRTRLRSERLKLTKSQAIAEVAASVIALLIAGAALAGMVWRALQGLVTPGELALFYQAFNQGQRLVQALLGNVGQLYANSLFLSSLFDFLALAPRVVDPPRAVSAPRTLREGIQFQQVTFRYPGSQRPTLSNFDLTIRAGQIAALLGPNGAGKSTVIKLLCRLYDPDEGAIKLDGTDLRAMRLEELRHLITVLFQEPVHYNTTVAENIALGDWRAEPDIAAIRAAAEAARADSIVAGLPRGYDQLLGKWLHGGTELSVGEWQRLALARAYLRQAPIIILDEPTSAMDPWAEADWLRRFCSRAAGRTVLIITHRLSTAMCADIVHVMADGQVMESGRHDELLDRGGLYARAWVDTQRPCQRSRAA